MVASKIDHLTEILKRLDAGEDPAKVKSEAKTFLGSITETDLVEAEQHLMQSDIPPEQIRHLCSVHMEMLGSEQNRLKTSLGQDHVITMLMTEHDVILSFLDNLEIVNRSIQTTGGSSEDLKQLQNIAEHLLGAEPHHQREEQILFPELERRGFFGPPQVMRMEHQTLRGYKREIKRIAESADIKDPKVKAKLDQTSKALIVTLRDHIFKENNILYPTALQSIKGEEAWNKIKMQCDQVGYCCFTPNT
ncbi:MAG: DUF438 domain-containing protein [Thaumarchaeota archaeon]|nr:DUF438 domain-containing protein [Nitrososphaerota archaeon]